MSEQTLFEHADVKVTNARFMTGGQTYAMSNVTSVKAFEQKPKRIGPILLILIGVAVMFASFIAGLIIVIIAGLLLYYQKTMYHVMLSTSGEETSALKTDQKDYIQNVVAALNEAIVNRG